ncbi:transcriptional repressor TCF25-domain-containing protein [Radiomyces spectabilis]|uniref:transcriptional repressor TCF25-domain-containing protein n=1 Tax=Radiomyces spectabilis TaxID=64574 RepID=UPI00221FF941|nr:transcriptional repressor TCF25-domain-containing protein [Radiomyces spectabilis]KAI8388402.1 transcriptional repressor TCF25-domain-containing protein [Radiomyces spectabilis]
MSSRALRRLQKQQLQELDHASHSEDDSSEEEAPPPKAQNLFDLLNEDQDDDDANDTDNADETDAMNDEPVAEKKPKVVPREHDEEEEKSPSTAQVVKSSKKNKKKKKKGKAQAQAQAVKSHASSKKDIADMSWEEFDDVLKEIGGSSQPDNAGSTKEEDTENADERCRLLSVNQRYLDAEAEMKRLFGSRVVNSENRTAGRVLKRSKLSTPKVDWPPYKKQGLSMSLIENKPGSSYYAFTHSEEYQDAQLEFLNCVASHDPNALMFLTHHHPYHVDGLLQVSEVAKHSGDHTVAGECIERALYACERAFHPHFSLSSGTSRLSYQRSENRSFFLAIFRHIQFLTRRGCWRTAFEFNKLLFSLDPTADPTGALLSIDYYALNAKDYGYLLRMISHWKTDASIYPGALDDLPNFAFSGAYAKFKLAQTKDNVSEEDSSAMLKEAIKKFPQFTPRLLQKLGESDPLVSQVQETINDPYLDLLLWLAVERNHELWKEPEVLQWLKQTAHQVKAQDDLAYQQVRCSENRDIPLNVCRHVIMSEIRKCLSYLPTSVTGTDYHMYDPLPPPDSVSGYDINDRIRRGHGSGAQAAPTGILARIQNFLDGMGGNVSPETADQIREMMAEVRRRMDTLPGTFPDLQDYEEDESGETPANPEQLDFDYLDEVAAEELAMQRALAEEYERNDSHNNHNNDDRRSNTE